MNKDINIENIIEKMMSYLKYNKYDMDNNDITTKSRSHNYDHNPITEIRQSSDVILCVLYKTMYDEIKDFKPHTSKNIEDYICYDDVYKLVDSIMDYYNGIYNKDSVSYYKYEFSDNYIVYIYIHNIALLYIQFINNKIDINTISTCDSIHIFSSIYTNNDINREKCINELKEFFNKYNKINKKVFIKYYYISNDNEEIYKFEDTMKDIIYQESYPFINNMNEFVDAYIKSDESLLFLYGLPGTGKSRFIRYIMQKMMDEYSTNDYSLEVLYTAEEEVLHRTNIFVDYINNNNKNLLVLEDMDSTFISRSKDNNNQIMSKFLSTSDGIIQTIPQKKMIFSSNIQNLSDVDEALLRRGRCFDVIEFRKLTIDESLLLINKVIPTITKNQIDKYFKNNEYTLADVYQIIKSIMYPDIDVPKHKKTVLSKVGF
jgi:hypothetical protein